MIGIPVTAAAYEAIKGPLTGQRGSPPLRGRDGLFRIWLDCKVVDEFGRLRGPGERPIATSFCGWRRPIRSKRRGGGGKPKDEAGSIPNLKAIERALAL